MCEQRDPMADMSMIKKWHYLDDLYELAIEMAERSIEALQQQLVCYRIGRRLINKLCDELEYTEEGWKEIKQRWDEKK